MTRLTNFVEYHLFKHLQRNIALAVILCLQTMVLQNAAGQENNRPFQRIRARLVNSRTGDPVVFARVIDKDLRSGVLSDSLGVFSMSSRINDTLYISSISYYTTTIKVTDSLVWQIRIPIIPLLEQAYELGGVDIYGWGSYQEFKYKFLHTPSQEDKTMKLQEELRKAIGRLPRHPLQEQASIPLGSPVTALYMLFSKEGKSIRRLQAAKKRDRVFLATYQKFNRDIVSQVTGLTGTLLDQFMLYCRPEDEFLLDANEYEINHRILQDYEKFKKEVLSKSKSKASP
jgi:hypothetical protein